MLARIDGTDARRSLFAVRRSTFVWTPIAAAAAIAIAVFIAREPRKDVAPKTDSLRAARSEAANPARAETPASSEVAPRTIAPRTIAPRTAAGTIAPRTAASAVAPRTVERTAAPRTSGPTIASRTAPTVPPALDANAVASIAVAPLVVDTMTPEPIHVERLETIAPIAVAPLDINDSSRRNP